MMDPKKQKALEKAGWATGGVQELLDLTDDEMEMIRIKTSIARSVREIRLAKKLSQASLAKRIRSSQPRVANAEKGEASLDMLFRSMVALGASREEIAAAITRPHSEEVQRGQNTKSG